MENPNILLTAEDILAALEDRYADLEQPLITEKTPWQHGVRAGIMQVILDIKSLVDAK